MKCICQMCDCGKHRCTHFIKQKPTKVTRKEPCNVTTEYKGEFLKTNGGPIVRQRPSDCIKPEGNVEFDTTHRNTFTAHKIERSPRKKTEVTKYERAGEPMSGDTEYGNNYLNEKAEIPRQASYLKKKTKLFSATDDYNEVSVTQQDYDGKKMDEKTQIKKLSDNHVPSTAPFEKKSVHQADYTRFNEPPSKTGRRPDNLSTKGQRTYFDTTSHSHYVAHAHKQEIIKKKPRDVYEPNTEPFTGSSLMRSDFGVHKDPIRSAPVPHNNHLFATDEPLQNKTTNLSSYKNWGIQKNGNTSTKEVSLYRPPSKEMDLQKTSDDYKDFRGMKPSKKLRPKTNISFGGDFNGESMYTNKFVKHDVNVRAKPIMVREQTYSSPQVPFEGCSESKDHYKKFDTSPAKMVRRINDIFGKDSAFDGNTSYMDQYVTKKIPKCPVLEKINTNFSGYNISDDIENGHRFLEKTTNCATTEPRVPVASLPPITA